MLGPWLKKFKLRNFRELEIWKDSIKLVKRVYEFTSNLPDSEKYGLVSQMNRCSVSIPSNIAEGCSKDSQKDFIRYLQISLGSAFELETQFEICKEIGYCERVDIAPLLDELVKIQKRTKSLINYARTQ